MDGMTEPLQGSGRTVEPVDKVVVGGWLVYRQDDPAGFWHLHADSSSSRAARPKDSPFEGMVTRRVQIEITLLDLGEVEA